MTLIIKNDTNKNNNNLFLILDSITEAKPSNNKVFKAVKRPVKVKKE